MRREPSPLLTCTFPHISPCLATLARVKSPVFTCDRIPICNNSLRPYGARCQGGSDWSGRYCVVRVCTRTAFRLKVSTLRFPVFELFVHFNSVLSPAAAMVPATVTLAGPSLRLDSLGPREEGDTERLRGSGATNVRRG